MVSGRLKMVLCVVTALAAGLLLRLWFVVHTGRVDGDTLIYGNIAKNWLQHGVYGFNMSPRGPVPTLIRLPGYPLFLAACFSVLGYDHYTAVMYLQCVIDLFTCVVVAALAKRWFGRRAALAALVLLALCPFTAAYTAAPLTETLTLTTIAVTFYGLERWRTAGLGINRWMWLTAASLAYSLLLRPEQGLLAAAVIPAMVWMVLRKGSGFDGRMVRVLPVMLVAVCVVLPLAPWAVRNWRTFHVVQPLAPRYATDPGENIPLGFQRWFRSWAIDFAATEEVYWNYDNDAIEIGKLPARAFDSESQYSRTEALLSEYNLTYNASPKFDARFEGLARERIQDDPIRYYVALPVARLVNMLFRPRAETLPVPLEWWRWREHPGQTAFAAGLGALNLAYFVLGVGGLWLWWRRGWGEVTPLAWAMVGFVVLRCALLLTIDNSEPRYTLEFFPLLGLWGSYVFRGSSGGAGAEAPFGSFPETGA